MNDTTFIPANESADPKGAPQRGVRIVHLVFGVLFLGLAAVWALGVTDVLQFDVSLAVVFPVILILAGAAGLVAMVANAARLRRRTKEPYES